jgi:hypothetical protein
VAAGELQADARDDRGGHDHRRPGAEVIDHVDDGRSRQIAADPDGPAQDPARHSRRPRHHDHAGEVQLAL